MHNASEQLAAAQAMVAAITEASTVSCLWPANAKGAALSDSPQRVPSRRSSTPAAWRLGASVESTPAFSCQAMINPQMSWRRLEGDDRRARRRARAVAATGRSWHGVLGACLDQLDPLPAGANLGVIYCSEALAPVADELVRALRARTGVQSWVGSCGSGRARRGRPRGPRGSGRPGAPGRRLSRELPGLPMAASGGVLCRACRDWRRLDPARCWPSSRPQAPRTRPAG